MKKYKKNVVWYEKRQSLNQIYSSGLAFAFVSQKNKQVIPFVLCRDFLQDAIQGFLIGSKRSIYGFNYDPQEDEPIVVDQTRLLVTNSTDIKLAEKIPACLDFLHQIERKLRISLTKARECNNPPKKYARSGVWYFEGGGRWMKSPPMISLYTLLIRVGLVHTVGGSFMDTIDKVATGKISGYMSEDRDRLNQGEDGIKKILEKGDRRIFCKDIKSNYPKTLEVGTMHNSCGIVGFARGYTKSYFPSWHIQVPPKPAKKPKSQTVEMPF
jgi:hypothetical protein